MGLNQSKPENRYVRDRVRFCDGLAPLDRWPHIATAGAGRFVFLLGGWKYADQPDDTQSQSAMIDYVDLLLSTRVRLWIGEYFNFGRLSAFYAIDERTVVIVDVNEEDETLRQRMIKIDPETATADAFLDRGYQLDTGGGRVYSAFWDTAVSEDRVLTRVKIERGRRHGLRWKEHVISIVYPKNPLDLDAPVDDLTDALKDASDRLSSEANTPDYEFEISSVDEPFFLSPTKIGFFTRRTDIRAKQQRVGGLRSIWTTDRSCIEYSFIVAYEMQTGDISTIRIQHDPTTNFPCNYEQEQPYDSISASCGKEVGLLITDRHLSWAWRGTVARLLETVAELVDYIHHFFYGLHVFFYNLDSDCHHERWKLLDKRKVRFGRLNTQTMQWCEQPGVADQMKFETHNKIGLGSFSDGHFLIYDRENTTKSPTRVLGCNESSSGLREDLRVLSNPGRLFSLKILAEMKLRKRPIARLAIAQIAARIQY